MRRSDDMERITRGLEKFYEEQMMQVSEEEFGDTDAIETDWDAPAPKKRKTRQAETGWHAEARRHTEANRRAETGRHTEPRRHTEANRRTETGRHADSAPAHKGKSPKKHRLRRFLLKTVCLLLILAGILFLIVHGAYNKLNYQEIESFADKPMKEKGVINILLIGNDSRENGEDGRSDAMILLSVNTRTKKIYMTSLLRDMYVDIPGYKNNRLNAAYSYGGAELLMKTVEQNLGVPVNRYMLVNFEAFANLVDAVGGVDLELTSGELELVNGYLNEYNDLTGKEFGTDYLDTEAEGMTHLNGPQALAYTRNRYIGTDFGRTERQRKVLTEVVHQLPRAMLHPFSLSEGMLPNLTTNLTEWECYTLTLAAPFMMSYDLEQESIPAEGTYHDATIRKMAVLEVDLEANKKYLRKLLYEE